jgi:hypothetical protein
MSSESPTKRNVATGDPRRTIVPTEAESYRMPAVGVATFVRWFPDRVTVDCYPAIVTQAGDRAISVSIFYPGANTLTIKDGVRHRMDPETEIIDRAEEGVWDYATHNVDTAMLKEIHELSAGLFDLTNRVNELAKSAEKK